MAIDLNKSCKRNHNEKRLPNGNCRSCENIKFANYYKKNKEKASVYNKEYKRLTRYGITPEQYQELFIKQNGQCKICGKPQEMFKRRLAVDHKHATKKVRGLLCHNCNVIVGLCYENTNILESAISYINGL